ncbi:MAG: DegT/DnrJ/EryC1/StrS family aminotransferase [Candidatus Pacebacteria bacterium]|nr:DegT/DnrJ/EryC1/StrS family aminotransferase [Candidatus Paceibacterota bacterium]
MKVPFVGYKIQYRNLKREIDEAIHRVLSQGDLILRKDVDDFEKNLAQFVGTKYAVSLNSGTDALFFSLLSLGVKDKDEVITVSHTFVASISSIVQAKALPVLIDVGDDFLINPDKIEEAITKKTKAVIAVHLNGRMCRMDKIMDIAQKYNLAVIEDSAQALGAKFKGQNAGSVGLIGCFSFYPAKILGCFGDGGAIVTNDEKIAEKIRLLRDHGQKTKTEIVCYGFNSRLDNLEAAILNVKIKYLPCWIKRRREIAKIYSDGLKDVKEIILPPLSETDICYFDVFQNYVLKAQKRDDLFNYLKEKEIETLIKDKVPVHLQKGLDLSHFRLSLTEQLAEEVISLPMYPELRDEQVNYVIDCIINFYKSNG